LARISRFDSLQIGFIVTSNQQIVKHIANAILKPIKPALLTQAINRYQMAVEDR
jgi:hypothetical protein